MQDTDNKRAKSALVVVILTVAAASIAYRLIISQGLQQSSLLFVGLPTLLALLIVKYTNPSQSMVWAAIRAVTLFLLISGIFLGEGIICILMAAPIFYGITILLAWIYTCTHKKDEDDNLLHTSLLIPIALLLAQVHHIGSPAVVETVSQEVIVSKPRLDQLNQRVDLQKDLPLFFKAGFPKPTNISGQAHKVGDVLSITFDSSTKGAGILALEVSEKSDHYIVFKIKSDHTHIGRWMSWKKIVVELDPNTSKVRWTSHYTCDLAPAWYFAPIERYAVGLSNQHLISTFFGQ